MMYELTLLALVLALLWCNARRKLWKRRCWQQVDTIHGLQQQVAMVVEANRGQRESEWPELLEK